jgi:hypothetical protein
MNVFRGGAPLGEEAQTLAERFGAAEARYATGAFVSAYTLRREVGLAQGFDLYNGGERANRWGHKTFTQALSWLESHRERHIFLWVHSYDAHGPVRRYAKLKDTHRPWDNSPTNAARLPKYQADPQISDPAYYREMYARGVEFSDEQVGRLVQALKEQDRYEDAMIILLADHGESLTERELWFDHGTSAHVEQLQVPLIVKYPGGKRAGSVDDRLVSLVDVAPTVLSVAGLPALPDPAGLPLTQAGVLHTELTGRGADWARSWQFGVWRRPPSTSSVRAVPWWSTTRAVAIRPRRSQRPSWRSLRRCRVLSQTVRAGPMRTRRERVRWRPRKSRSSGSLGMWSRGLGSVAIRLALAAGSVRGITKNRCHSEANPLQP